MFDSQPFDDRFAAAIEHFTGELKKISTGRANASMLDGIKVEVYGSEMPINQVASVLVAEATQLLITPFDPTNIPVISAAIRADQNLGFNPSDDGKNIRVQIPALTEERRREIVKNLGSKVEDTRIQFRNIRQDALKLAKTMQSNKELSEDDVKRIEKDVDDTVADYNKKLEEITKVKEQEIMTI